MRQHAQLLRRGATLLEVLVGCGVFAFLMLSSIAIMNIGTGGYRGVESKAEVARQLNRFEADITGELKRGSRASVGVYTPSNDYRWALWFKTPMNALSSVNASHQPLAPLGDSAQQMTDTTGAPIMQRYILYYVTRMDPALHLQQFGYLCSSYASTGGPDTICPHKWIIKKELYLMQNQTTGADTIGLQTDAASVTNLRSSSLHLLDDPGVNEAALYAETDAVTASSAVHRAQIVARNVLSFEVTRLALDSTNPLNPPTVSASGPIVLFDVKVFKSLTANAAMNVGSSSVASVNYSTATTPSGNMVGVSTSTDAGGAMTVHTSSSIIPSASTFTVQLDNRVIPLNP